MIAALLLALGIARANPEIAVLQSDDLPGYEVPARAFEAAIDRPVHVYDLQGDYEHAMNIAARLRKDPPPLVFAVGAKAAWIAAQELPEVPLVYAMVLEPERYGVVGPRSTGVAMYLPTEMALAQLHVILPDVKRLGVLMTPAQHQALAPQIRSAAAKLEITTVERPISSTRQLRRELSSLRADVDALWLLPSPELVTPTNFRVIRDATLRARLPLLTGSDTLVKAGALLCVIPDPGEVGDLAAQLARTILDAPPDAPLPAPVVPERPRVVMNLDTLDLIELELDPVQLDFVDEKIAEELER